MFTMSVSASDTLLHSTQPVVVTVDAAGSVSCVPVDLNVSGPDVLIAFHLDGSGWAFPDSGAVVVGNPGGQFPLPSRTVNGNLATPPDRNTAVSSFGCTVTVRNNVTGRQKHLDPTIRNLA